MEYVFENGLVYAVEETETATKQKVTEKYLVSGVYWNPEASEFEEPTVEIDKKVIKADGADTAIITVKAPNVLSEITFYNADTNESITTVQVDTETHTATLQVTATATGTIHIRAGEPTLTKLNEVEVLAQ